VLKLTHVINWSWWWVTLPFWIGLAIMLVILISGLLLAALVELVDWRRNRRKRRAPRWTITKDKS
jgi:CHASE1-domain containing sensor protein